MKEKILIVFFISLSLSLLLNAQVWDEPKELGSGWCSHEIAYDSDNMTYIVWPGDDCNISFIKSSNGGGTWSEIRYIGRPYFSENSDIAVDSNNNICVVFEWSSEFHVHHQLFFTKSTDKGEDWSNPKQIAFTAYSSAFPCIVIDSNDVIHVIWNEIIYEPEPPNTKMGVFHISSEDGGETWSDPVCIEKAYESNDDAIIDSQNNIYVFGPLLLDSGEGKDLYCFKSEDAGTCWTYSKIGSLWWPAATVDLDDTLHVITDNLNDMLYYQYSLDRGETWSEPEAIAFLTGTSFAKDIEVDEGNNIIVVYQSKSEGNYEIHYIRSPNRGLIWIREWKLTETLRNSFVPTFVIDQNYIIHLVWNEVTEGTFDPDVYYIRGFLRGKRKIK